MKSSYTIPIAIVLGGLIVAGAVYVSIPKGSAPDGTSPSLVRPVGSADHILGNPAARVMIVEYADFDCTYCKDFNDTMHQILADRGVKGDVAWAFRQFPLIEIHPNAMAHARAAECAAEAGGNEAFWKFEGLLYANQPVDPTTYGALAREAGIDGSAFAACYADAASTLDARIMADRQNALDMGAGGTPYSVILVSGKAPVVMEGGYSYDAATQLVEQALAD